MKILLPAVNLHDQTITDITEMSLNLDNKYLTLLLDFTADEPVNREDHLQGTISVKRFLLSNILKSKIIGTDIIAGNDPLNPNTFKLTIITTSQNADINIFCNNFKEAHNLNTKILKYIEQQ